MSTTQYEHLPSVSSYGSVRLRASSGPLPGVPVRDAQSGEASIIICLDRPPSAKGGVHEQRTCVAFVVSNPG
ncbi:hypothetical protein ACP3WD_24155, partial [Salmonella enterica]|uniref:hypothetical protein n=1 Tax=Salmonella enterica TaxID=28901 RepID=UPI003CE78EDA